VTQRKRIRVCCPLKPHNIAVKNPRVSRSIWGQGARVSCGAWGKSCTRQVKEKNRRITRISCRSRPARHTKNISDKRRYRKSPCLRRPRRTRTHRVRATVGFPIAPLFLHDDLAVFTKRRRFLRNDGGIVARVVSLGLHARLNRCYAVDYIVFYLVRMGACPTPRKIISWRVSGGGYQSLSFQGWCSG
jgi:hypothetical protein